MDIYARVHNVRGHLFGRLAKLTPLYCASTSGSFTAGALGRFHSACDAQGTTLTVVLLNNNALLFGYTGASWTPRNAYIQDNTAFVARLEPNGTTFNKFNANPAAGAVHQYSHAGYGPTFGNAHTLYVALENITTSHL